MLLWLVVGVKEAGSSSGFFCQLGANDGDTWMTRNSRFVLETSSTFTPNAHASAFSLCKTSERMRSCDFGSQSRALDVSGSFFPSRLKSFTDRKGKKDEGGEAGFVPNVPWSWYTHSHASRHKTKPYFSEISTKCENKILEIGQVRIWNEPPFSCA